MAVRIETGLSDARKSRKKSVEFVGSYRLMEVARREMASLAQGTLSMARSIVPMNNWRFEYPTVK